MVVEGEEDVCPYATKPIRAVANVTLRNNLIILNFLVYEVAAVIAAKGHPVRASEEFGEPGR
jgi:hypothetical protein